MRWTYALFSGDVNSIIFIVKTSASIATEAYKSIANATCPYRYDIPGF